MSPNEIAKAILELLNESPSNDKKLLDMFSWENVGKMHVRLYASLLDKSPSRSNSKLGKFFASEI
jgi:hypothetical protein